MAGHRIERAVDLRWVAQPVNAVEHHVAILPVEVQGFLTPQVDAVPIDDVAVGIPHRLAGEKDVGHGLPGRTNLIDKPVAVTRHELPPGRRGHRGW